MKPFGYASALLTLGLLSTGLSAHAQSPHARPSFHRVELSAGFSEDPKSFPVRAAGAIPAERLDENCEGYIADPPTLTLVYEAGSNPLYISAASDADTTLTVHQPDGSYRCNDDSGHAGTDAGLTFSEPQSGRYAIWVGTYNAGEGYPAAMVHFSETGYQSANPFSRTQNIYLAPDHRVNLADAFDNDPFTLSLPAGGDVSTEALEVEGCRGFTRETPSLSLLNEDSQAFYMAARMPFDGTLVVRTPTGRWLCSDDEAGELNPGVFIETPEPGEYLIWPGSVSERGNERAEFTLSRLGFFGIDQSLDPSLPPLSGQQRLRGGFTLDPTHIVVQAGGPILMSQYADEIDVAEGPCRGRFSRAPNFKLDYRPDNNPLLISAIAREDTTLAVQAPNGRWYCDDDSANSLNPGITFPRPERGAYHIYVGRYSDGREALEAQLFISQTGYGAQAVSHTLSLETEPRFGRSRLRTRFLPDPQEIDVVANGLVRARRAIDSQAHCAGFITPEPSHILDYRGEDQPLYLYTRGRKDTTLAVQTPNGDWLCDDDGALDANAGLEIESPQSGEYKIFVGRFSDRESLSTKLYISENAFERD